jgi:hypothetical protein
VEDVLVGAPHHAIRLFAAIAKLAASAVAIVPAAKPLDANRRDAIVPALPAKVPDIIESASATLEPAVLENSDLDAAERPNRRDSIIHVTGQRFHYVASPDAEVLALKIRVLVETGTGAWSRTAPEALRLGPIHEPDTQKRKEPEGHPSTGGA